MKKFLLYLFYLCLTILIVTFGFWKYLNYQFDLEFSEKDYLNIKQSIQNTPELPSSFLNTYKKLNTITNTKGKLMDNFQEKYNRKCPCLNISSRIPFENPIYRYILANRIENDFTQDECLIYLSSIQDFTYNNKGIFNASEFFFKKDLKDLNKEENQILVLMMENPIRYNPIKFPKEVEEKLKTINKSKN